MTWRLALWKPLEIACLESGVSIGLGNWYVLVSDCCLSVSECVGGMVVFDFEANSLEEKQDRCSLYEYHES